MSMNETPSAERVHIGFFGSRNAGKSSLVNAITGQPMSLVSDIKGTTTDAVMKAMEILPLGPVVIIDTAGFDDEGELGKLRIKKTREALNRTDIAVLVVDASLGKGDSDLELEKLFKAKEIPYLTVYNKCDTTDKHYSDGVMASASDGTNINLIKETLASLAKQEQSDRVLCRDLVKPLDIVVLVVPIDSAAPKGRLILPQQQVIRDLLEGGAVPVVCRDTELADTLEKLSPQVKLVITDSQAFEEVAKIVPEEIPLTSFSILMARYKGFLDTAYKGAKAIDSLKDGDTVLISEGCTHHRQCDDIGTVKLPRWLKKYTGKELKIETSSGRGFPEDLSKYSLIIHCGGCMLNARELDFRKKSAIDSEVPFTNYGIAIAHMKGILERSTQIIYK